MRLPARHLGAVCAVLAVLLSTLIPMQAHAAGDPDARVAHRVGEDDMTPKMLDISTPYFNGYSKKLKAYKFTVLGHWNATCHDQFCWPAPCVSCNGPQDIGSNDAVRIKFSDAVVFKKMSVTNWGGCGNTFFHKTRKFRTGSFEDAFAGVDDRVQVAWQHTTHDGDVVMDQGYCKDHRLPVTSGGGGGTGGSGTYALWGDLRGRGFKLVVWVNPVPSQGRCYDRLYVKGGYTHTWTDQSLEWSLGYPWSIGVGVGETPDSFTAWQDTDAYRDPTRVTPRMCHH
jgi:hypothetical protein